MRLLRVHDGVSEGLPPGTPGSDDPPSFSSPVGPHISPQSPEPFFELVEFVRDIPPYAILSHTWEDEEVTFQDMQDVETAKKRKGYAKIMGAGRLALADGFEYLWVDSCCINKESSAELSEVLNSMYHYYANSEVCYTYLSDVRHDEDPRAGDSTFRKSKWFTRGWTLQELIAPVKVVFYDKDWVEIGSKFGLYDAVTAITRIPAQVLFKRDVSSFSIAKRMSWAAWRQTTRPEDRAYSLMGLFGVNIPPIYGEGLASAFLRLQREIINVSNDRSIFAWVADPDDHDTDSRGLLAKSPFEFRWSGSISVSQRFIGADSSFSITNSGTKIRLPLVQCGLTLTKAYLHCHDEESHQNVVILLRHGHAHGYTRCNAHKLLLDAGPLPLDHIQKVYVSELDFARHTYAVTMLRVMWDLEGSWSAPVQNYFETSSVNECGFLSADPLTGLFAPAPEPPNFENWGTERRKGQQDVSLEDENELVLVFNRAGDELGQRTFAVVLRKIVHDGSSSFMMKILTGRDVLDLPMIMTPNRNYIPITSPLPPSIYQATANLPRNETVSASLYKPPIPLDHKSFPRDHDWVFEIRVASEPEQPVLAASAITRTARTLSPPKLGFIVHTGCIAARSNAVLRLLKVFPADFFQEYHGPSWHYISIDPHDSESDNAYRLLMYDLSVTGPGPDETLLRAPVKLAVILGIQDSKAWSQTSFVKNVNVEEDSESVAMESLLRQSALTRRWEDEEPYVMEFQLSFYGFIAMHVTVGKKDSSILQPASHWAHVEIKWVDGQASRSFQDMEYFSEPTSDLDFEVCMMDS
ncbi:hypothetical protein D9758_011538 [Tetrapyrgos nigripes]|uniref:Heterokaryon incompatibility domain-containing protein n=1 Tax=Tetrapyrgos nigripes TaxID=182062 RepID=A0A8H5CNF9_9AGAR|nr:hypothetical protein D9758_011538 [Tetrapyrgos nigripes]